MALLNNDELNSLHRKYFEIMDISTEQMLERIELAELLDDAFLYLFTFMEGKLLSGDYDVDSIQIMFERRYSEALAEYGISFSKYPEIEKYVSAISKDMVDSTIETFNKASNKASNKPKQAGNSTSANNDKLDSKKSLEIQNRAILVAENESNTVFNTIEYSDAVSRGYKYKTWITEGDSRVRATHTEVDGERIKIEEPFLVGNSQMMYPKDMSLGATAEEIVNCRCSVFYS